MAKVVQRDHAVGDLRSHSKFNVELVKEFQRSAERPSALAVVCIKDR